METSTEHRVTMTLPVSEKVTVVQTGTNLLLISRSPESQEAAVEALNELGKAIMVGADFEWKARGKK